jgi:hypothetical protein
MNNAVTELRPLIWFVVGDGRNHGKRQSVEVLWLVVPPSKAA